MQMSDDRWQDQVGNFINIRGGGLWDLAALRLQTFAILSYLF